MPDDPTLEAAQPANDASLPAEEGKTEAAVAEPEKQEPDNQVELSEAEKIKLAMQKRIDRQTSAFKAQQEQLQQLKAEVEAYKAKAPKEDGAPKQDDFDDYDKWQDALVEYRAKAKADELINASKEADLKAAQERQHAEARRVFDAKEDAFRKLTPDYDRVSAEAVETMNTLAAMGRNISPLRDMVMQFDNPPEMVYRLGADTSLIESLVSMEPIAAMRELVKLEIAMQASKAPATTVPDPIKPVSGKGGVKPLHERSGKDILAHFGIR